MSILKKFSEVFWSEWFWLPNNVTWNEFEKEKEGIHHPHPRDLYMAFFVAAVILVVRYFVEKYVATPIGISFGLSDRRPTKPAPNPTLEASYKKKKSPSHEVIQGLAKQTDLTIRQVERWFRRRQGQDRPTKLRKFTETFWRFCFYFPAFFGGLYVMWDKPWLWDTRHCWYGYPQPYTMDMYWYYMIELGFYWSLIVSLIVDNKRKDFVEMTLHHFVTIALMSASWSGGTWRIGTLVLVTHDAVDYILEAAKMTKYLAFQKLCDFLFVFFMFMWFLTRLLFYPLKVLNSSIFEFRSMFSMFPLLYSYNGLLCILQVLHVIWFSMMVRMAYLMLATGKVDKDDRSETEVSLSKTGESSEDDQ